MYEKTTLSNGLRIITHAMPTSFSVSAVILVGAGSRYESAEQAGISHFLEHMLFKGTRQRPTPKAIAETIEGVGGVLNAGTEKELTSYYVKVAHQHGSLALELLTDMLRHSRFLSAEVEKERHVITEEIHMTEDMPQELVNSLIDELIWPDHPLGREIAGTEASVKGMRRPSLLAYVHERYVPNNMVVSVAGNVRHEHVVEEVRRLLGSWRPGPVRPYLAAPGAPGQVRQAARVKDIEQAHLCVSAGGLPRQHPDRRALDIQNLILGGGMSSRLFLEIRERRALAYDVQAYLGYFEDTGASVIYAGTDPEQLPACLDAILEEMRRLRCQPVAADELKRAKEYLKGRMLLGLEDNSGLAHWLGSQELLTNRIQTVEEIIAQVDAVTADDVQRVSQSVFAPTLIRMAVVGPATDGKALEDLLEGAA
jgi:predicted Zn-dependent peptidase